MGSTQPSSNQGGNQGGTQGGGSVLTQDMLQQMLSQITPTSQAGATQQSTTQPTVPPGGGAPVRGLTQQQQAEVLYRSQLEQLANMGFPDRQRNITGLYVGLCPGPVLYVLGLQT